MPTGSPKQKVEELLGRRDAIKGEIKRAQAEYEKFSAQNLSVEVREAKADIARLQQRLQQIETALAKLKKYW
ncbi:MAG: hypothetical protein ACD_43C00258G0001 [uncultured bacterium]|nr:MAG: hypothetical protein ACD_43C00258G0001 [uncultured bacterium]